MEKFYKDERTTAEINAAYAGKKMGEIQVLEKERAKGEMPKIDNAHAAFVERGRKNMLTVGRLVEWLKKQDQDACVLAWEDNSRAYIEQFPDLPSPDVCTVEQCMADTRENLKQWYRGVAGADEKIEDEIKTSFRYARHGDVIIKFC